MRKVRKMAAPQIAKRPVKKPKTLRDVPIGRYLPSVPEMEMELAEMIDVLLGREEPPIDSGVLTLQEVADAYFARGMELTIMIQGLERAGELGRGDEMYKFRTGELRSFVELAKRAGDLGSRRLTAEQLRFDAETTGRESDAYIP